MTPNPRTNPKAPSASHVRNERGAVLVLMAFALVVFLGIAALAIDLGLLFVARGEAQRAADAAAHAGAGFFQLNRNEAATRDFVVEFASNNSVRGIPVEVDRDEDIDIEVARSLVRVRVRRTDDSSQGPVATLFSRALGINELGVSASAAAQVYGATLAECILPIAIPDRYQRYDGQPVGPQEAFNNNDHFYVPTQTGFRLLDDIGREVFLRPGDEGGNRINPSWWNTVQSRDLQFATPGAVGVANAIQACDDVIFGEGEELETATGNLGNRGRRAFLDLLEQDLDAEWDPDLQCVTSGDGICRPSPRLRPVVFFDPTVSIPPGRSPVPVTRLIPLFIESVTGGPSNYQVTAIMARGLGLAPGDFEVTPGNDFFLTAIRIVE